MTKFVIFSLFCCFTMQFFGAQGLQIEGSQILDSQGNPVALKGFNWFGFNNGQTMLDGLWSNNALSGDFATVVRRQKLLGFNAVRLPFSFKDFDLPPRTFVHQNCKLPTDEEVAASVTPAGEDVRGPAPKLPNPPPASSYEGNTCNAYLPSDSVRDRFMYVVKFYAENGFYVMIDNHLREDQTALEDAELWTQLYADLIKDLMEDPVVAEHLIVDILNEPDHYGVSWETVGDLYISAMDAIDAKTDGNVIYGIEGTEQSGLFANWGDGFATTKIAELGIGDPRPFFNELLTKPYKNRVILAPHVYPPSVTFNNNGATGKGLYTRLTTSFGTKTVIPGYCNAGDCIVFPVAIGEFGSRFEEPVDITMMNDFAKYMNDGDEKHAQIDNWFYWSWNANSGDTGGIVENNWLDIEWIKVNYLQNVGLEPWYNEGRAVPPLPTIPSPMPSPSPSPVPPSPSPSPSPVPPPPSPSPSPVPPPTSPSPSPSPIPVPVPVPPVTGTTDCAVRIQSSGTWPSASSYALVMNIFVKNTGKQTINSPWNLEISGGMYDSIVSSWNWSPSVVDGVIVGKASESWLTLTPNSEGNIGFIIQGPSDKVVSYAPSTIKLNGEVCKIDMARIA